MSGFLWHVIGDMTGSILAIPDEDKSDLYKPRYDFSYQKRSQATTRSDPYGYVGLWPRSRMTQGDPSQDLLLGVDASEGGRYEPLNFCDTGAVRLYFIHGVCRDGVGNPLGGAVIDFFLTANAQYVSSATTDSNGIYSAPSIYTGQAHKGYANYGPDTLVGATVDTLLPTLSPW